MSFDAPYSAPQRIAIVGGGISGLSMAYQLAPQHEVVLFEAEPRLGGHARTVMAGLRGDQPVDTGFIVFNHINYPHLTRMFLDLDVPIAKSSMSFGATVNDGEVEYGLSSLRGVFGQRRNLARPAYLRMLRDIFRWNANAERLAEDDEMTIGELVSQLGTGRWFRDYYLMPICGAIWSTPQDEIDAFPARSLVRFFRNHALLSPRGQHQWWTVDGGSVEYVSRLARHLRDAGCDLREGTPVQAVRRKESGVEVASVRDAGEAFDQVVFACHADQALRLLEHPTKDEEQALSAMRFQDNRIVLHRDARQMPHNRDCWSSWVYRADAGHKTAPVGVTYWMNRLQNIADSDPMFISLNPARPISDKLIYDDNTFRHPVFDRAALRAQQQIAAIQGHNNTWYAGAYLRHGFHEDGFASSARVARQLAPVPA